MFSKKDMLSEEELRQITERIKVINSDIDLPESLSPHQLHKKLTPEDCRNFREAGHPDFMGWQRYAGMVASFIVVLAGIVLFSSGYINLDNFAPVTESAAAKMSLSHNIAAMDMDEAADESDSIVEEPQAVAEEAEAEMAAAAPAAAVRSRLYASGYEYILSALDQNTLDGAANASLELLSDTDTDKGEADTAGNGLTPPEVTWQKEFTDTPGESSDILKSDGAYFYYYTAPSATERNGKVHIIEAETLTEVSGINVGANQGTELFIRDGFLILVSKNRQGAANVLYNASVLTDISGQKLPTEQQQEAAEQRAEAYGITTVSVYDLSDVAQPRLVRSFMQDGFYQNSRLVGGRLYLFTRKDTVADLTQGEQALLCDTLPVVRDSYSGEGSAVLDSSLVALAPNAPSNSYTTVSMFEVASDSPVISNSVLGATQCYLSDGAVYFCYDAGNSSIGILRMTVGMDMNITSQTVVRGSFDLPFAINRHGSTLRVATVSADESGAQYSNVYLMDDSFQMIGSAEGLGTGEKVTEICFVGNVAYITSRREQRPVFAVDVSKPSDVVILGQLDIEDLPQSFRLIEGSMLISVQNGVEEPVSFTAADISKGWVKGKYEAKLPGVSGSSIAARDYRALLYNGENQIIGFPVICRQTNGSLLHWGYAVYKMGQDSIMRQPIISHAETLSESIAHNQRSILRGRVVSERLYTFSGSMVKAHDIHTMQEVKSLTIR